MASEPPSSANPNPTTTPTPSPSPLLLPAPPSPPAPLRRPPIRVTSEFDSDSALFFHKLSCKLLGDLAKLKLSFHNTRAGVVSSPQLGIVTKNVALLYDLETRNALFKGSFGVGERIHFRAYHDVKEEQGEMAMVACLADPSYKLELSSPIPLNGSPRASLRFPLGEVTLEKSNSETKVPITTALSLNAALRTQVKDGFLSAFGGDDGLRFRYAYKDKELTFIPSLAVPSNALSFAFKRRFSPLDKLSYSYNFPTNDWSAVYKHTVGKDLKLKAGYDSAVRLGWASVWVGDETGKAKTAPMKMKVQVMLQVRQDDPSNPEVLFRVKKRWDF